MKLANPVLFTRLSLKRQKVLLATYHSTVFKYAKDKQMVTTETKKLELIEEKEKKDKLAKYEISSDIMAPPPPDEVLPNPRDPNNPVDNRFVPRVYHVSAVSKSYTHKAEIIFDSLATHPKNLKTFKKATKLYLEKEGVYHRGMVEFITVAMEKMKEFNVHLDLKAYKALLDVFPKGRLKPQGYWQAEFMHYPKQQDCAITLVDTMEENFVMPDTEFCKMLEAVFGRQTYAYRKLQRSMYWMPKFANINPYPIPRILPEDKIELAKLALKRMAFDINTVLSVWHTNEDSDFMENEETSIVKSNQSYQSEQVGDEKEPIEEFTSHNNKMSTQVERDALVTQEAGTRHKREDTFIVSAQSPEQQELIRKLSPEKAVFVDGGFNVWLRNKQQTYFILRAEPGPEIQKTVVQDDEDEDLFEWTTVFEEEKISWMPKKKIHEQDDGVILGMCITGTSSRDSLVTWIRHLQQANPHLEKVPVVFTLKTEGMETALVIPKEKQALFRTGS